MATIYKPKKKKSYKKNERNEEISKLYNTSQWRNLRNWYLQCHPLCERCLEQGKLSPTQEIHHKIPISTVEDIYQMQELAYDENNLMALCRECHHQIHNKKSGN